MEVAIAARFPRELARVVRDYATPWIFEDLRPGQVIRLACSAEGCEWSAQRPEGCRDAGYCCGRCGRDQHWRVQRAACAASQLVCEWELALGAVTHGGVDFGWVQDTLDPNGFDDGNQYLEYSAGAIALVVAKALRHERASILVLNGAHVERRRGVLAGPPFEAALESGDVLWSRYDGVAGTVSFAVKRRGTPIAIFPTNGEQTDGEAAEMIRVPVAGGRTLAPAFALASRQPCGPARFSVRVCG
jgi:hypothetical protein